MNRKQALSQIFDDDIAVRLVAAQVLQKLARPTDLPILLAAREKEKSPWVESALDIAIRGVGGNGISRIEANGAEDSDRVFSPSDDRDSESRAIELITRILNHEIGAVVGRLEIAVNLEIPKYKSSASFEEVQALKRLASSIETLATAARTPVQEEFELGAFVRKLSERHCAALSVASDIVSFVGPEPLIVSTDRFLLELVLLNGLRNSVEALRGNRPEGEWSIVVTWGTSRGTLWIAINDNGPGLSQTPKQLLEPGASSKPGHSGFGLYIAKQAARSIGGEVNIGNASEGGAIFRIAISG